MNVIKAGPDDTALIAPLFEAYRVFYGQTPNPDLAYDFLRERLTKEESAVLCALEDSEALEPVGFTQLYPCFSSVSANRIWILNDLFVKPEARGKGVGRALLERARLFGAETGASKLVLATAPDNAPAQHLYEASGWQRDLFLHYKLEIR